MNITRALSAALPDIPARTLAERTPRMDPDTVAREHIEDGEAIVRIYVPSAECMYKFPPQNWALIQLFDGRRNYEEIAQLYSQQSGGQCSTQEIREFAEELDAIDFWYKTAQEKNVALMQKSADERRHLQKKKSRYGDLSLILFPAVNPDKFLTWLYRHTRFFYTPWFTLVTLCVFGFSAGITISHWSEIGRDTLEFYNFSDKTWLDVVGFYLLALVVLVVHELGHGHASKHYGGRVQFMGFALIYLAPAFYTDITEGEVTATRYERMVISLAGVWIELVLYSIIAPIWLGTPPYTVLHDACYTVMLITGISAVLLNWNPLIKLDGYYILTEILGIVDLKEDSTAFVSGWVKHNIWRLPVEVPYVPKRRRLGYAVFALLSGLYSYTVLYVVATFVGNVFRNFNPEWSFVPEIATAAVIFWGRIRTLGNFMKFVYLDKKDRIASWFTPQRSIAIAAIALVVALLPLRRESSTGYFVLEAVNQAVIRSAVPGVVTGVYAAEGQWIPAGATVVRLRNALLDSRVAHAQAQYSVGQSRVVLANLRNSPDLGAANTERIQLGQQTQQLTLETAQLELRSPIAGLVLTPRLTDEVGTYLPAGTEVAEVADLTTMRARVHVSEHDLSKFHIGSEVRLLANGYFKIADASVAGIEPAPSDIPPGLIDLSKYKGLRPPNFYVVIVTLSNRGGLLKPGMVGTAKVYGQQRSLAGFVWREIRDFCGRRAW
jgi:putative peptide zinc metalloprotease protein